MKKIAARLRTVSAKAQVKMQNKLAAKQTRKFILTTIKAASHAAEKGCYFVQVIIPLFLTLPPVNKVEYFKEYFTQRGFCVHIIDNPDDDINDSVGAYLKLTWLYIRPLLGN